MTPNALPRGPEEVELAQRAGHVEVAFRAEHLLRERGRQPSGVERLERLAGRQTRSPALASRLGFGFKHFHEHRQRVVVTGLRQSRHQLLGRGRQPELLQQRRRRRARRRHPPEQGGGPGRGQVNLGHPHRSALPAPVDYRPARRSASVAFARSASASADNSQPAPVTVAQERGGVNAFKARSCDNTQLAAWSVVTSTSRQSAIR